MRFKFWDRPVPSPSGECAHMFGNWSPPIAVEVQTTYYGYGSGTSTDRPGWAQDRYCLKCNLYERRLA